MDTKKIFPFDIFGKPKLCLQCDRLSYLRCFCCNTIYCSGECQLKDWVSHHEVEEKTKVVTFDKAVSTDNNEAPLINQKKAPEEIVVNEQRIEDHGIPSNCEAISAQERLTKALEKPQISGVNKEQKSSYRCLSLNDL